MYTAALPHRCLLRLTGEDALPFLQGLLTNDVMRVARGEAVYAALLTPQGKFLHDLFLYPCEGGVLVDAERARVADLISRLKLYRLRSKVTIEALPDTYGVMALWGEGEGAGYRDPRHDALGYRWAGELNRFMAQGNQLVSFEDYDGRRIRLRVPEGSRDMMVEKSLILDFGFERLHGVDFAKGCYVGQEVTARMKYRATSKKSLYCLELRAGRFPLQGTMLTCANEDIGHMGSHCGSVGLALLRCDGVKNSELLVAPAAQLAILASPEEL